ncbi:MAG: hypothetical protein CSB44_07750 [Gammaproteobacteria bacterium]|nr:MAG: hypothetical protein CSB44_07750 [Gammaproteobacteria bacterium]PIE34871.1 MAG: hypothetical protein CSA54_06170 [Gammaproteobacteria bacterium]
MQPEYDSYLAYDDEVMLVDIDLALAGDNDFDGYYTRLDVMLDIDAGAEWEVYVDISLEDDYGNIVYRHEGGDFVVYNDGYGDTYEFSLGFRDGLPRDYYQMYISIHDAWNGDLLDAASGYNWSSLRDLPLESRDRDDYHGYTGGTSSSAGVEFTAAGALDGLWLAAALLFVVGRVAAGRR